MGVVCAASVATVPARALPPPGPPRTSASVAPTAPPSGAVLPFGSQIYFVLEDGANSGKTTPGTVLHMHLRDALVVDGTTVAAAGTPATLRVVSARKSQSGDVDGALQIFLDPLALPGRDTTLPIRAIHEYLTAELTGGQRSTRSTTDSIIDVFVPYGVLLPIFRKGRQMVLPVGSVLRAETAASIDASDPRRLVIATPPPFVRNADPPHADLTPAPLATPAPLRPHPLPRGKATLPPSAAPSPSQSAVASPSGSTSPAASVSPTASASPSASPAASASAPVSTEPSPAAT